MNYNPRPPRMGETFALECANCRSGIEIGVAAPYRCPACRRAFADRMKNLPQAQG
jgi:hypothetical protein